MARVFMLLFVVEIVLVIVALISCLSAQDAEVRALPRAVWIILILLFPLVGPIAYLATGRPVSATTAQSTWRIGSGFPESGRPKRSAAPDDDPDFLRTISQQSRQEDEDMLRRWEEDLRRREKDLRKQEDTPPTDS